MGLSAYSAPKTESKDEEKATSIDHTSSNQKSKSKKAAAAVVDPVKTLRPIDIYRRRHALDSSLQLIPPVPARRDILSADASATRSLQCAFERYSPDLHQPLISNLRTPDGHLLSYLDATVESLTVSDVTRFESVVCVVIYMFRLLAEYKYMAKACSVLLTERKSGQRFVLSPSGDSLSESVSSR